MKVSELNEYQDKQEKTGIKVWDHVCRLNSAAKYTIIPVACNHYAAVRKTSGVRWMSVPIEIENAMDRNLTKSELEQLLGDLDNWEVVE